ncbi:Dps family protein [Marinicella rhabdoformis]|uniref:Dps family protein n=1 Tax=Marinicella rhabdoformis TaxID=2580566 RepID=UPI0012AECF1C|nr:Dps family protein [Marinicella rhabdoformis]
MSINTGIDKNSLSKTVQGLSELLADSYTLYLKTHNYHWNVTGPQFTSLHQMFEEHYTELATAVDVIAERIRALGAFAPGSYSAFANLTAIEEAGEQLDATGMVKDLLDGHETLVRRARTVLQSEALEADDVSGDLLTQRLDVHEKTAWMLRALLG